MVQTNSHGIDGEVAPILIVLQCAILNDGFPRIVAITLTSCTNKLHLKRPCLPCPLGRSNFYLGCAKISEHAKVRLTTKATLQFLCHSNTTAYHDDVNVIGRAFQKNVTYIAAYHIAFNIQMVSNITYHMEYRLVEQFGQFLITIQFHGVKVTKEFLILQILPSFFTWV